MSQTIVSELTFHYLDGRNESFTLYESIQPLSSASSPGASPPENTPDPLQHHVRHLLGKDWWVLNLPEKSVLINMDTVVKVEINPPLSPQHNDSVAKVEGLGEKLISAMPDL